MNSLQVEMLSQVYNHVDDVDLFLGGLMEKPLPGSLLGPTFSCIISDQMYRTMVGDRFFYSTINQEEVFNEGKCSNILLSSHGLMFSTAGRAEEDQPCQGAL